MGQLWILEVLNVKYRVEEVVQIMGVVNFVLTLSAVLDRVRNPYP